MNTLPRILTLALAFAALSTWTTSASAARLASLNEEAGEQEKRESAAFRLSEQAEVVVGYTVTKRGESCNVQVRIHREQNGRWLVVNTVMRSNTSSRGSRRITLPAGSYKVEVVATKTRYDVTVDN